MFFGCFQVKHGGFRGGMDPVSALMKAEMDMKNGGWIFASCCLFDGFVDRCCDRNVCGWGDRSCFDGCCVMDLIVFFGGGLMG